MKLLKVEKFKGSATEYINKYIIPTLPENNVLIEFSDSLDNYLKNEDSIRIIRKFGDSKFRGSRYTHQNINYIVSDNEAALWMYMQSMEDGVSDYEETIKNKKMPIAFAITKEERERGLIYNKYGKQRREKEFSQLGYKHCHLFECSPRGKDLDYLNLNQRMIRLLNPMNHFPFPSNRKYEMPYDYGEKKEFLSLVLQQLLDRKYKTKNDRIKFEEFIEKSGSSKLLKNKVEDFEINIGYEKNESDLKETNIEKTTNLMKLKLPNDFRNNFYVSQKLYGQNEVINVTFNNGRAHHGESYVYDHDNLVEACGEYLNNSDNWNNVGNWSNANNIPRWAMETGLVKRIK